MTNQEAIFEKARELGELIKISPIKQKADETSKKLLSDAEAKTLIDGYNRTREQKMMEFKDKQPTPEEAQQVNQFLQEEFEKIASNATIKEYLEAARDYEMLLGQMDSILKHFIVGEEEHSCGGSCSTCGGCH
ncbi:MAG: YlbF family regulator [Clostridiales bacterium]|nr:YlbF family regulator [Clostridiales bacterium]